MTQQVLVVGASRGIGAELVRQYLSDGARVTATARDEAALQRLSRAGARAIALDLTGDAAGSVPAWPVDGERFDTVILNAGVYGPRSSALETPTQAEFDAVMHVNVLGAMRVLPSLVGMLAPDAKLGVVSSGMGSIGSRSASYGWLYRASKAALNSVLKDVSLVLAGRAICVALHPGWVRTDMGGAGADLDVADSAAGLRRTLAALKPADNGRFFNHDGSAIAW